MTTTTDKKRRSPKDKLADLKDLCKKVHRLLYVDEDAAAARLLSADLERALNRLPADQDQLPVHEEGWALFFELQDNLDGAIHHRKREIGLLMALDEEAIRDGWVFRATANGRRFIIGDDGSDVVAERKKILQKLRGVAL